MLRAELPVHRKSTLTGVTVRLYRKASGFYNRIAELPANTSATYTDNMDDATASWHLDSDGRWERHHVGPDGPLVDLQAALISRQHRLRRRSGTGR